MHQSNRDVKQKIGLFETLVCMCDRTRIHVSIKCDILLQLGKHKTRWLSIEWVRTGVRAYIQYATHEMNNASIKESASARLVPKQCRSSLFTAAMRLRETV